VVILDIAVPRDFDPRIHDGDRTCLFNIDDLKRIREQTLHDRRKHVLRRRRSWRRRQGVSKRSGRAGETVRSLRC